jgi:hypothetical protein
MVWGFGSTKEELLKKRIDIALSNIEPLVSMDKLVPGSWITYAGEQSGNEAWSWAIDFDELIEYVAAVNKQLLDGNSKIDGANYYFILSQRENLGKIKTWLGKIYGQINPSLRTEQLVKRYEEVNSVLTASIVFCDHLINSINTAVESSGVIDINDTNVIKNSLEKHGFTATEALSTVLIEKFKKIYTEKLKLTKSLKAKIDHSLSSYINPFLEMESKKSNSWIGYQGEGSGELDWNWAIHFDCLVDVMEIMKDKISKSSESSKWIASGGKATVEVKYFVQEQKENLLKFRTWLDNVYSMLSLEEKQEVYVPPSHTHEKVNETLAFRYLKAKEFLDRLLSISEQNQAVNYAPSSTELTAALANNNLTIIEKFYLLKAIDVTLPKEQIDSIINDLNKLSQPNTLNQENLNYIYNDIINVMLESNSLKNSYLLTELVNSIIYSRLSSYDKYTLFTRILYAAKDKNLQLTLTQQDLSMLLKIYNDLVNNKQSSNPLVECIVDNNVISPEDKYKLLVSIDGVSEKDIREKAPSLLANLLFFNRFDFAALLSSDEVTLDTLNKIDGEYKWRLNLEPDDKKILEELNTIIKNVNKDESPILTSRLLRLVFFHKDVNNDILDLVLEYAKKEPLIYKKIVMDPRLKNTQYEQQQQAILRNKNVLAKTFEYMSTRFGAIYDKLTGRSKSIATEVYFWLYETQESLTLAEQAARDLLYFNLIRQLELYKNDPSYDLDFERFIKLQKLNPVSLLKRQLKKFNHWDNDDVDGIKDPDLTTAFTNSIAILEDKIEHGKETANNLVDKTFADGNPEHNRDKKATKAYLNDIDQKIIEGAIQSIRIISDYEREFQKNVELELATLHKQLEQYSNDDQKTLEKADLVRKIGAIELRSEADLELVKKYYRVFLRDGLENAKEKLANSEKIFPDKITKLFGNEKDLDTAISAVTAKLETAGAILADLKDNNTISLRDFFSKMGVVSSVEINANSKIYSYVLVDEIKLFLQSHLQTLQLAKANFLAFVEFNPGKDVVGDQSITVAYLLKVKEAFNRLPYIANVDVRNRCEQSLKEEQAKIEASIVEGLKLFNDTYLTRFKKDIQDKAGNLQTAIEYIDTQVNTVSKNKKLNEHVKFHTVFLLKQTLLMLNNGANEVAKLFPVEQYNDVALTEEKIRFFGDVTAKMRALESSSNELTDKLVQDVPWLSDYYKVGYNKRRLELMNSLNKEQERCARDLGKEVAEKVLQEELNKQGWNFLEIMAKYLSEDDDVNQHADIKGKYNATSVYTDAKFLESYKTEIKQGFKKHLEEHQQEIANQIIMRMFDTVPHLLKEPKVFTLNDIKQHVSEQDAEIITTLNSKCSTFSVTIKKKSEEWLRNFNIQKQQVAEFVRGCSDENILVNLQNEINNPTKSTDVIYKKLLEFELQEQLKNIAEKTFEKQVKALSSDLNKDLLYEVTAMSAQVAQGLNSENSAVFMGNFNRLRTDTIEKLNKIKEFVEQQALNNTQKFLSNKIASGIEKTDPLYKSYEEYYSNISAKERGDLSVLINKAAEELSKVPDTDVDGALYNAKPYPWGGNSLKGLDSGKIQQIMRQVQPGVEQKYLDSNQIQQEIANAYEQNLKVKKAELLAAEQTANQQIIDRAKRDATDKAGQLLGSVDFNTNSLAWLVKVSDSVAKVNKGNYEGMVLPDDYKAPGFLANFKPTYLGLINAEKTKILKVDKLAEQAADLLFNANQNNLNAEDQYALFNMLQMEIKDIGNMKGIPDFRQRVIISKFVEEYNKSIKDGDPKFLTESLKEIKDFETKFAGKYLEKLNSRSKEEARSIGPLMAGTFFMEFFKQNKGNFVNNFERTITGLGGYVSAQFADNQISIGDKVSINSMNITYPDLRKYFDMPGFKREFKTSVETAMGKYMSFIGRVKINEADFSNNNTFEDYNTTIKTEIAASEDPVYNTLLTIRLDYILELRRQQIYNNVVAAFNAKVNEQIRIIRSINPLDEISLLENEIINLKESLEEKYSDIKQARALKGSFNNFKVELNKRKIELECNIWVAGAIKEFDLALAREIFRVRQAITLDELNKMSIESRTLLNKHIARVTREYDSKRDYKAVFPHALDGLKGVLTRLEQERVNVENFIKQQTMQVAKFQADYGVNSYNGTTLVVTVVGKDAANITGNFSLVHNTSGVRVKNNTLVVNDTVIANLSSAANGTLTIDFIKDTTVNVSKDVFNDVVRSVSYNDSSQPQTNQTSNLQITLYVPKVTGSVDPHSVVSYDASARNQLHEELSPFCELIMPMNLTSLASNKSELRKTIIQLRTTLATRLNSTATGTEIAINDNRSFNQTAANKVLNTVDWLLVSTQGNDDLLYDWVSLARNFHDNPNLEQYGRLVDVSAKLSSNNANLLPAATATATNVPVTREQPTTQRLPETSSINIKSETTTASTVAVATAEVMVAATGRLFNNIIIGTSRGTGQERLTRIRKLFVSAHEAGFTELSNDFIKKTFAKPIEDVVRNMTGNKNFNIDQMGSALVNLIYLERRKLEYTQEVAQKVAEKLFTEAEIINSIKIITAGNFIAFLAKHGFNKVDVNNIDIEFFKEHCIETLTDKIQVANAAKNFAEATAKLRDTKSTTSNVIPAQTLQRPLTLQQQSEKDALSSKRTAIKGLIEQINNATNIGLNNEGDLLLIIKNLSGKQEPNISDALTRKCIQFFNAASPQQLPGLQANMTTFIAQLLTDADYQNLGSQARQIIVKKTR